MNKITLKIAIPIVLTGFFAIIIFMATGYDKLDQGFYIVFLFFSVYIFLFGVATGESLSSPIKKLIERATQLSEGDLKTRIYLETKDEFGELGKIFNKIAEDLEESKTAGARAEGSIDIRVKARTQALEETINALEQKIRNRTIELDKASKELEKEKQEADTKETELATLKQEVEKLKSELLSSQSQTKKPTVKKTKTEEIV
jgi:methyl-accepting chemotaxis protein